MEGSWPQFDDRFFEASCKSTQRYLVKSRPHGSGGVPYPLPRPRNGRVISTPGSEFDGYARNRTIWGNLGRTAKRSHFEPPRPSESDSQPRFCTERTENQLIWSILEPFGEDFVPNQARSDPTNLGEPGYGFCFFFFNWGPLILKVPKRLRKRHNWIAELARFKMR